MRRTHLALSILISSLTAISPLAWGAPAATGIVTIVEGTATLIRGAQRLSLPEGTSIEADDIIQTGPDAFVQVELTEGDQIGIGGGSRWMLLPRFEGKDKPLSYLLEGWIKWVRANARASDAPQSLTRQLRVTAADGAWVLHATPQRQELFVERGEVKLIDRGSHAMAAPKTNDFATLPASGKFWINGRPGPDFLAATPRAFQDTIPPLAKRFENRKVVPKPQGDVSYDDIAPWLQAEPALRQAQLARWRPRASDKRFVADVQAHLASHPEWRPIVNPEWHTYKHGSTIENPPPYTPPAPASAVGR